MSIAIGTSSATTALAATLAAEYAGTVRASGGENGNPALELHNFSRALARGPAEGVEDTVDWKGRPPAEFVAAFVSDDGHLNADGQPR